MEQTWSQSKDPALEIARGASRATLVALLREVEHLRLCAYDCGIDGVSRQELALHVNDEQTPILHLLHNFVAEIPLERRIEFLRRLEE